MQCNSAPHNFNKIEQVQKIATKINPEIRNHRNHSYLDLIRLVQRRPRGEIIEVFKYLNEFTIASVRGLLDNDRKDRTRNNGAK